MTFRGVIGDAKSRGMSTGGKVECLQENECKTDSAKEYTETSYLHFSELFRTRSTSSGNNSKAMDDEADCGKLITHTGASEPSSACGNRKRDASL